MQHYKVLDALLTETTYISAQELARTVGATKSQILYWGTTGYIEKKNRKGKYHNFPIQSIPKAKIMATLVCDVGMEPERASKLADRLLDRFEKKPDASQAVLEFLMVLSEHLDEVIDYIDKDEAFRKRIGELRDDAPLFAAARGLSP
jgi:DNA-binding transcriptional MerR regulator